jgi:hypothetical protein
MLLSRTVNPQLAKASKTHEHKDLINQLLRDKRPSLKSANHVAN